MKKSIIPKKQLVASLDVHAQKTFTPACPDELPIPEGDKIAPELNAQAQKAQYRIGSKEAHNDQAVWIATEEHPTLTPITGDNVDVTWPPHSRPGTKGFEHIDGLPNVTDYDFYIWEGIELDMHPYGVCYHDHANKLSTGIIEFLHSKHINTVIVGGLATDYCVKISVLQLLQAGFNVVVNLGACRGMTEKTIRQAIDEMKAAGAKFVASAADIENQDE